MMKTIRSYESFNQRRYSDPWAAKVLPNGKMDFKANVGGYTGARRSGEAGDLYIIDPEEGAVYAYGRKDYRGSNSGYEYVQYRNGEFVSIEKTELVKVLNESAK